MDAAAQARERQRRLATADHIIELCRALYPVRGLIVSPDLDRAFERVREEHPDLVLHSYPTGSRAEDWVVPPSWQALEGRIETEEGRVLASLADSFLFVAPYSEPVEGLFTKAEIARRCRTRPDQPDAFFLEHRNAYDHRLVDWGITLPHALWESMPEDARYRVVIETELADGALKVAECVLPGRRPEIICLCSQFDELCNDGQSSALLGLELLKHLAEREQREFSYQVLMVPELIGTLFYAFNNREVLDRTVAMLNLETLGAGQQWVLKRALRDGGSLEAALEDALTGLGRGFEAVGFFGGYGNDERVYAWPRLGVPGPGLQRFPFAHYHTSHDTPERLDRALLAEALEICETAIETLERNYVPRHLGLLPPWLTKHDLYFDVREDPAMANSLNGAVLYGIDGRRSVLGLARDSGLPFETVWRYLEAFAGKGMIEKRPLSFEELRAGA